MDELKLVVGDTFENVASIQDCHFQQRDSVQTLGKILTVAGNAHGDGQMFPKKNEPRQRGKEKKKTTTVSVCRSRSGACSASAAVLANNGPFLPGVNTKQLSNQMLELTKVINELKDVLIQQVTGTNSPSEAT